MIATIQAALASVAQSLPDAALLMSHGGDTGTVLAVSSVDMTQEPVTADAPQEMRRVVGSRADFPSLEKGSTVQVGEGWHLVTSAKLDPIGASITAGLSAALDAKTAEYKRSGTQVRQPIQLLAVESEVLDAWSDNIAPTTCRAWFCCISADHWLEVTEPQIGDELAFDGNRLRVAAVTKKDGCYILTCRARR